MKSRGWMMAVAFCWGPVSRTPDELPHRQPRLPRRSPSEKSRRKAPNRRPTNSRTRDFMVDAAGKVYNLEEQLDIDEAPVPIRRALKAQGTIVVLESVMENGATTFQGQVKTTAGKKLTMELDAAGKPVKK